MTPNQSLAIILLGGTLAVAAVIVSISSTPSCRGDEVLVRGTWSYVCVKGHR